MFFLFIIAEFSSSVVPANFSTNFKLQATQELNSQHTCLLYWPWCNFSTQKGVLLYLFQSLTFAMCESLSESLMTQVSNHISEVRNLHTYTRIHYIHTHVYITYIHTYTLHTYIYTSGVLEHKWRASFKLHYCYSNY